MPGGLCPQEDSWYSFLSESQSTQGHNAAGRIRSIEKCNDINGNRTRDLPACSKVKETSTGYSYINEDNDSSIKVKLMTSMLAPRLAHLFIYFLV
jgi:hypothetical protein